MIARPLDLASRLRPPPQGMGTLHYVNVGLLVVFFGAFGSRFVLAPGLGVDFQLPQLAGAQAGAAQATDVISVLRSGQILTSELGLVESCSSGPGSREGRPRSTSRSFSSAPVPR
jgi:hypothetical protein